MSEAKKEEKPKADAEEPKIILCRCVTSVVAAVLIFVIQTMALILAILQHAITLGVVASVILLVVIFTFISFCGSYSTWKALQTVNKICLFAISLIFAGALASCGTIIGTLHAMPMHNADETRNKDKYITLLILVIIIFVIQFILFLVMYIPLFHLYEEPAEKSKDVNETTSLKSAVENPK
jgi:membrane-bound ClpP family serine protease